MKFSTSSLNIYYNLYGVAAMRERERERKRERERCFFVA
jgi:hypothetical protein